MGSAPFDEENPAEVSTNLSDIASVLCYVKEAQTSGDEWRENGGWRERELEVQERGILILHSEGK